MKKTNQSDNEVHPYTASAARWRAIIFVAILFIVSLLLGYLFVIMAASLFLALASFIPPGSPLGKLIGKRAPQQRSREMKWWQVLFLVIKGVLVLAIIGYGVNLLFTVGFCMQNFFC